VFSPNDSTNQLIATQLSSPFFVWNSELYDNCTNGSLTIIANDGVNDGKAAVGSLKNGSLSDLPDKASAGYFLKQNFPNPFKDFTTIEFQLPKQSYTTLKVLNMEGKVVDILIDQNLPAGRHRFRWVPKSLQEGIYVYRLQTEQFIQTKKLVFKN
jgi:hypothetical protein